MQPSRRSSSMVLCLLLAVGLVSACFPWKLCACTPPMVEAVLRLERDTVARRGYVGYPLQDSIVVRLESSGGRAIAGVPVRFSVLAGQGVAEPERVFTDVTGRARTRWTLGYSLGSQRLVASVEPTRLAGSTVGAQSLQVSAEAELRRVVLRIAFSGSGHGAVIVQPLGVRCELDSNQKCELLVNEWSVLQLQAVPGAAPKSRFVGWSAGCSGVATCELRVGGDAVDIGATFDLDQ